MPNRLAHETSPYLLQHADNPVDWYPWGTEALERARQEDKPILLSIGYAACHWCHVMAHESFEDPDDRAADERAFRQHQSRSRGAARPRRHLHAGRAGADRPRRLADDGFSHAGRRAVLTAARTTRPKTVMECRRFTRVLTRSPTRTRIGRDAVAQTSRQLREMYDAASMQARRAKARSRPHALDLAYRGIAQTVRHRDTAASEGRRNFRRRCRSIFCCATGSAPAPTMRWRWSRDSFRKMARGGIYDQVGGGFHRYAVDAIWLVPHFEKMLYDNALLVRLGANLWQATHDDEVRRVTEETVTWVAREMTSPEGGFYSSLDADSEGQREILRLDRERVRFAARRRLARS